MVASNDDRMFADPAKALTETPTLPDCPWLNRRAAYFTVVAVILIIYSYPALRTVFTTRSLRLPAVSAPDLGLYLSLSKLEKSSDGEILNPYYHIRVPYPVGYLKFRLSPILFGLLNDVFEGRIWWALFVWNLWWWLLLCLAAIWLFERFLPQPSVELVLAGVSLLILFSIEGFGRSLSAVIHRSPMGLSDWLPYIRPFSPQVIMPLFLCYLGLLIRALRGKSLAVWGMMAFLQFVAFAAYPYATLMMAGVTACAALWYVFTVSARQSAWRVVLGFLLVCSLADMSFALHGSGGSRYGFPDQTSLIKFQPSLLGKSIGKEWLLTGILVIATATTRKLRPEVKWPLVGLGVSNMLFVFGDAVVSEHTFFLSDHIGYFYQPTITILFIFLLSAYIPRVHQPLYPVRIVSLAIVGLCVVYGFSTAEGNYRENLPHNVEQADLAQWFGRSRVSPNDLVITQFAGAAYDNCEWIPLLSEAEVLYCRNAQLSLTPDQNRDVQRLREVMYLYFEGKDRQWFDNTNELEKYGFYGELSSFRRPEERAARALALRREMLSIFDRMEDDDHAIHDFFRRFQRVWIVQDRQNPGFVNARLNAYLNLTRQEVAGTLVITSADPK